MDELDQGPEDITQPSAASSGDLGQTDIVKPAEPPNAGRLSPYAITGFVLSLIGLWMSPQGLFAFRVPREYLIETIFQIAPPTAAAIIALWLARRAEGEIILSEGRLGGVGFFRATRVVAVVTLGILVLGTIAGAATGQEPETVEIDVPAPEQSPNWPDDLNDPPEQPNPPAAPAEPAPPGF